MNTRLVSSSKFLSLILRHKPEEIGLKLDASGWADIDELITLATAKGKSLTRSLIEEIVVTNDKKRFIISEDGTRIRANQGHSISVELDLPARQPPAVLFHGTATRFLASIENQGLLKGNRQHVHLSSDEATAVKVGQRHGRPIVLRIAAMEMHDAGYVFYLSENVVWLTEHVPPAFLRITQVP
jgi:putative RNA 2'-phosphotransferase